jgi:hypothetical protein
MKRTVAKFIIVSITIICIMLSLTWFYMFLQTNMIKYLLGAAIALILSLIFIFEDQHDFGLIKNVNEKREIRIVKI